MVPTRSMRDLPYKFTVWLVPTRLLRDLPYKFTVWLVPTRLLRDLPYKFTVWLVPTMSLCDLPYKFTVWLVPTRLLDTRVLDPVWLPGVATHLWHRKSQVSRIEPSNGHQPRVRKPGQLRGNFRARPTSSSPTTSHKVTWGGHVVADWDVGFSMRVCSMRMHIWNYVLWEFALWENILW